MAYGRNYRRRRRNNFRRKPRSRRPTAGQVALAKVRKIERQTEVKFIEPSNATDHNCVTGYTYTLTSIAQGTANDTRVGNMVTPTSLRVRFQWGNMLMTGNSWRIIIYSWKAGAASTGANTALNVLKSVSVNSFKTEDARYSSKILYDRTFWKPSNTDAAPRYPTEIVLKKLPKFIAYADGSSSPQSNGLYMTVINDLNATTPVPYIARFFFKDA